METRMSSNQEKLDALAEQLVKVKSEIVKSIDELKAQVLAGESLDFSRVDALVQSLDDLNPDEVATPEEPEEPSDDLPE